MRALPLKLVLAGVLMATAACSKKHEELPPPPPPQQQGGTGEVVSPGTVTSTVVPGSLEDMIQQAGSDRVFFAYDSYELDDAARSTLNRQATWLQRYPNIRITIEGHADERGTREYNLALGDRRANAVKNYLAAQGVDVGRINTISYGKERPAVQGSDEEAYAQNRRGVTVLSGGTAG